MISVLNRVENVFGKGENPGQLHFLHFPYVFKSSLFQGHSNSGLCGKELTLYQTRMFLTCRN